MKQYICTICGYIHETDGELPNDFKCPLCGAGRDAFVLKDETSKAETTLEKPHAEKELSPMEMSIICSNLARGCESIPIFRQMWWKHCFITLNSMKI